MEEAPGILGMVILAGSWAALGGCHMKALAARDAVEQGLKEALGDGLRDAPPAEAVSWRRVALPFPSSGRKVTRVKNQIYGEAEGLRLKLDVYHHADRPTGRPVLLQVHGGAWVFGRKDDQGLPLMHRMADEGWVCVAVNYRLSPRFTFPAPVIDIKRAIAWIRENIAEYGGDGDFIVITGGSAGGHLSSLVALTPNDPAYQPGFETADTAVKGCVPFYGIYDFTNDAGLWHPRGLPRLLERRVLKASITTDRAAYEAASPYLRAGPHAPPFLIIHGSNDTLVPVAEARRFADHLREVSKETVSYVEVPGAQHAFEIFPSVRTELVIDGAARFLSWLWARESRADAA